jgi:phytoene dehydrogenase-like protein
MSSVDAIVVGAGLAGLACAEDLTRAGLSVRLLEASDRPGGRVRTDPVDGFLLDRGFQVLLEAYPECRSRLDYDALDLRPFYAGALVRAEGGFHRMADPASDPMSALRSASTPVGSLVDKLRTARLARKLKRTRPEDLLELDAPSTLELLRNEGFSEEMIRRFYRPFFGGILLDPELDVWGGLFRFYFRVFSDGPASLPAGGMERIPEQLARRLPPGTLHTGVRVEAVTDRGVRTEDGEEHRADRVVVAVEGPEAARILGGEIEDPGSRSVHCFYFDAPEAPIQEGILILNGEGRGVVNNLAVLSEVAPEYAPEGRALLSATVLEAHTTDPETLESEVRTQMEEWFGPAAAEWRLLRQYTISHAQPLQLPEQMSPPRRPVRLGRGRYICGDHRDNASLNGALASGSRAARALLDDHATS